MNDCTHITPFVRAYLSAALAYAPRGLTLYDYSPEALRAAIDDCAAFQSANEATLRDCGLSARDAARAFWFARNRLTGFNMAFMDGRRLQARAETYAPIKPCVCADGQIHFVGANRAERAA